MRVVAKAAGVGDRAERPTCPSICQRPSVYFIAKPLARKLSDPVIAPTQRLDGYGSPQPVKLKESQLLNDRLQRLSLSVAAPSK